MWWAPAGSERLGQTSVKVGQPWLNLVKVGQTSPKSRKCALGLSRGSFDVAGPCRV